MIIIQLLATMRILLSRGLVYQAKENEIKKNKKNNLRETPLAVTRVKKKKKEQVLKSPQTQKITLVRNRDTK